MTFDTSTAGIAARVIAPLISEEPLEARLLRARERSEEAPGDERAEALLEAALLESLLGRRAEAEALLSQARASAPPESKGLLELASVLVILEAGHPARMAGALERAECVPGLAEEPSTRALSHLFHVQMLLLDGAAADAVRAAAEGRASLPGGAARSPLTAYALLVSLECLLAAEALPEAGDVAAELEGREGCTGVLAARAQLLRVRPSLARGGGTAACALSAVDVVLSPPGEVGAAQGKGAALGRPHACTGPCGTPIPGQVEHRFRSMWNAHSGHVEHRFRASGTHPGSR